MVLFDLLTSRWLLEASPNNPEKTSNIWKNGYEDPTYLTFKVEFGGWGYSTHDINWIKAKQRSSKYSGAWTFDQSNPATSQTHYSMDDYPEGLLDVNFLETEIKDWPAYSFMNQFSYNAYNWLLSRNEDTRAEYLRTFIEGLYEILEKTPFIFQSISGLESLNECDPTKGSRIPTPATIELKCIEGLQQKIQTLLQCYMRAAYDAEYQRWILPENYRQFTMIIYVFERRVFHGTDSIVWEGANDGPTTKTVEEPPKSNWKDWLGVFEIKDQNSKGPGYLHHPLNALLPVMAYECKLCEFAIKNKYVDSVNSFYGSGDAALESSLTINVKNVRTFYTSGLLDNKLKDIIIGDLIREYERFSYENVKLENSFSFDVPNLSLSYPPVYRHGFGVGNYDIAAVMEKWELVFELASNSRANSSGLTKDSNYSTLDNSKGSFVGWATNRQGDEYWWKDVVVNNGQSYDKKKGFFENMWDNMKSMADLGTQHIRVGPGYINARDSVYNNILEFIQPSPEFGAFVSYATRDNITIPIPKDEELSRLGESAEPEEAKKLTEEISNTGRGRERRGDTRGRIYTEYGRTTTVTKRRRVRSADDTTPGITAASDNTATPETNTIKDGNIEYSSNNYSTATGYTRDKKDRSDEDTKIVYESMTKIEDGNQATNSYKQSLEDSLYSDVKHWITDEMLKNNWTEEDANALFNYWKNRYEQKELDDERFANIPKDRVDTSDYNENTAIPRIIEFIDYIGNKQRLEKLENGIKIPDMNKDLVVLDKDKYFEFISTATSKLDPNMEGLDKEFTNVENNIMNLLKDGIENQNYNPIKNMEGLEMLLQEGTKDTLLLDLTDTLEGLLKASNNVIDTLPPLEIVSFTHPSDENTLMVEMPKEVFNNLMKNILLFSIDRPSLAQLSMQTLMGVKRAAVELLLNTKAILETIEHIKK